MKPKKSFSRIRVFGLVGVVWGGLVILEGLAGNGTPPADKAAYAAGHTAGMIFGGLLFLVGLFYLVKG